MTFGMRVRPYPPKHTNVPDPRYRMSLELEVRRMAWLKPILKRDTWKTLNSDVQVGWPGDKHMLSLKNKQKFTQLNWDYEVPLVFPLHFTFCFPRAIILLARGCFACLWPNNSTPKCDWGLCRPESLVSGPTERHAKKGGMGRKSWGVGDTYRNSSESPKNTGVLVIW